MSKPKYSAEFKCMVAKAYLNGEGSYQSISRKYDVGTASVELWVRRYQNHGENGFIRKPGNTAYSSGFKQKCVEAVIIEGSSVNDIVAKHNISSRSVLQRWISVYNANKELKDYDSKREVYMAEARRKTTFEERREIVDYCINHDHDYKNTAAKYDVSYSQVYSWVKKYDADGEDGRKGHGS